MWKILKIHGKELNQLFTSLFHDRGRYHTETSPLVCRANQWTGFYMTMASVMKELKAKESESSKIIKTEHQEQPLRGVARKRCSDNMQQMYRRTPLPKCDFNNVAKQLYWNHTSEWVFFCKFAAYFSKTFS